MIMIAVNLKVEVMIITNLCGNKSNNKRDCKDNGNNYNDSNNNDVKT